MPLAICATPIGNLDDVTLRVLAELGAADRILCEDTRRTRVLLARHGIDARLESYHRHNEVARTPGLIERLRAGERVALVSDAGLPGVNDPGARLISTAVAAGLDVTVLPGASAVETALVASGLGAERFQFVGYLPRRESELRTLAETLRSWAGAVVAFESPRRLPASLRVLADVQPERRAAVCRELTKRFEEVVRGSLEELAAHFTAPRAVRSRSCWVRSARSRKEATTLRHERPSGTSWRAGRRGRRQRRWSRGSPASRGTRSIESPCNNTVNCLAVRVGARYRRSMFACRATRWAIGLVGALAWALGSGSSAWAWAWPADGEVLREYSVSSDKYAAGQHRGIDIELDDARAVRAPASGEVSFAGQVPTHGLTVTIVTAEGYKASLTHLGKLRVREGASVAEGDPLADPGPTGTAEHEVAYVHLGIRVGDDEYVDPLALLPSRGAPSPPPAPAAPPAQAPPPASAPPPAAEQPAPPLAAAPEPVPAPPAAEAPTPSVAEPEPVVATPAPAAPGSTGAVATAGPRQPGKRADPAMTTPSARRVVDPGGTMPVAELSSRASLGARTDAAKVVVRARAGGRAPRGSVDRVGDSRVSPRMRHADIVGQRAITLTGSTHSAPEGTAESVFEPMAAAAALLAAILGCAVLCARRVARRPLPIIGAREPGREAEEDSRGSRLAVCERPQAYRACRRLRRPVRHVRPIPPAPRERRPHGQRDGRAWDTRHGRGGRGRRVAA